MINYFKRIRNKIKSFLFHGKDDLIIEERNFTIRNTFIKKNISTKKFNIISERSVPVRGKIKIVNKSRPLRCSQCLTEKSYTKKGSFWECKKCKNRIRAI